MSTKKIQLKVVTPERLILDELVDFVVLPTTEGEITVLPGHIAIIATMKSGDIVAHTNGEEIPMAVVGGFLEVKTENNLTTVAILADFAEHVSNITDEEIEKAKAKSIELKKLADNNEIVDFEHFAAELERSLTRVKIADKWKTKKYRK